RLQLEAADRAMTARVGELRPQLQAAKDFMAEAKRLGLTAAESTLARAAGAAAAGGGDPLAEAAFTLALGGVSPPVRTPAGLVILKSGAALPAGLRARGVIRDTVATSLERQHA